MPCGNAREHRRKYFKKCFFKCKDGKHFFKIPKNPRNRKKWLEKLGLKSASTASRICNNHFSEDMLTKSGKRIKKNGYPNKNIPTLNGYAGSDHEETSADHIESLIDNLLCTEDVPNQIIQPEPVQQITNETQFVRATNNCMRNASDITSASDSSVMNYQLQKHDNIVEIPEFILVFTAFRANNTVILPPTEWMPQCKIKNVSKKQPKRRNRTIDEEELWKESNRIKPAKPVREIRYVPYEPTKVTMRRAREIQVDMAAEIAKSTTGIQCDLDEQGADASDERPQFDWINKIIENHVFNTEGDFYECHICGEIAASYASNLKHAMVHKEMSSLCFECGRLFPNHVKLKHHEKMEHQPIDFEVKKALRCPKFHCNKAFHSKRQLHKHIDQHTKGVQYKCEKCWRIFNSFLQFHIHKSRRNCLR